MHLAFFGTWEKGPLCDTAMSVWLLDLIVSQDLINRSRFACFTDHCKGQSSLVQAWFGLNDTDTVAEWSLFSSSVISCSPTPTHTDKWTLWSAHVISSTSPHGLRGTTFEVSPAGPLTGGCTPSSTWGSCATTQVSWLRMSYVSSFTRGPNCDVWLNAITWFRKV